MVFLLLLFSNYFIGLNSLFNTGQHLMFPFMWNFYIAFGYTFFSLDRSYMLQKNVSKNCCESPEIFCHVPVSLQASKSATKKLACPTDVQLINSPWHLSCHSGCQYLIYICEKTPFCCLICQCWRTRHSIIDELCHYNPVFHICPLSMHTTHAVCVKNKPMSYFCAIYYHVAVWCIQMVHGANAII